jgi:hypothetical protein
MVNCKCSACVHSDSLRDAPRTGRYGPGRWPCTGRVAALMGIGRRGIGIFHFRPSCQAVRAIVTLVRMSSVEYRGGCKSHANRPASLDVQGQSACIGGHSGQLRVQRIRGRVDLLLLTFGTASSPAALTVPRALLTVGCGDPPPPTDRVLGVLHLEVGDVVRGC